MNIHPLFVHFPIAFLATYAILEIAYWLSPRLRQTTWAHSTKLFLLYTGTLSMFVAAGTGDMAAELLEEGSSAKEIVETHEVWAGVASILFTVLTLAYLSVYASTRSSGGGVVGVVLHALSYMKKPAHIIAQTRLTPVLALAGLVLLIVVGSLGAAMVYGPDVEPIVRIVYTLFF